MKLIKIMSGYYEDIIGIAHRQLKFPEQSISIHKNVAIFKMGWVNSSSRSPVCPPTIANHIL